MRAIEKTQVNGLKWEKDGGNEQQVMAERQRWEWMEKRNLELSSSDPKA